MRRISRQGKPPMILDKEGPVGRTSARTDVAGVPALRGMGSVQL